jgi:hypothetical protein
VFAAIQLLEHTVAPGRNGLADQVWHDEATALAGPASLRRPQPQRTKQNNFPGQAACFNQAL